MEVEKRLAEEKRKLAAAAEAMKQREEAMAKQKEEENRLAAEKKLEEEKLIAATTPQVPEAPAQQQNLPALEIGKSCTFTLQYKDKGSGGDLDVSIYGPTLAAGFRSIGSYAQGNYDAPNGCIAVVKALVESLPNGKPPFVSPSGYDLIWDDKNSGADMDGSVWQPRAADSDYVCLGSVGQTGYSQPHITGYACVHKCLVKSISTPTAPIWTDAGTGATAQVTIYQLPGSQAIVASPGRNSPPSPTDLNPTGMCQ